MAQLFVQGVSLVLGSGVSVIAVQATATLCTQDMIVAIAVAIALFSVCMGLVVRIVLLDGYTGALMRMFNRAYGNYAGYARFAQQLLPIVAVSSLARTAFALVIADSAQQKLASNVFVILCMVCKLYASWALDTFNAVTGVMEIARWVIMVPVLAGVAVLGVLGTSAGTAGTAGTQQGGHSQPVGTDNVAAMVGLGVTTLYGLFGMETVVDKVGTGIAARSVVKTMAGVLVVSSAVYMAVAVLTAQLVSPSDMQVLLDTGNTAQLNDVLLRLCLEPMQLPAWAVQLVDTAFQGLVFVSLINGASSLMDLNIDCLHHIGYHSPRGSILHQVPLKLSAGLCVTVINCVLCEFESASELVHAVSAFIVLSHLLTGIAFAASSMQGWPDVLLSALHTATMAVLSAALLYNSKPEDKARLCVLMAAAVVLPLCAAWATRREQCMKTKTA